MKSFFLVFFIFTFSIYSLADGLFKDVATSQGLIRGYSESGTYSFKGVPFAKPPVGDLRFRRPQELVPSNKLFRAFSYGQGCVQSGLMGQVIPKAIVNNVPFAAETLTVGSENCLTLNIWAPKDFRGEKLPVGVFVHGGAHTMGSNAGMPQIPFMELYNDRKLARENNVIMVTVNYRLGPLGYLAQGDEIPANLALWDIIAALEWVQKNIAAFGGDPEVVTLFGESAGGGNTEALLASPRAKGLFSRAIVQSGHPIMVPVEEAESAARRMMQILNCHDVECLRLARSAAQITMAFKMGANEPYVGPTVGGDLLERSPLETFRMGLHNKVPVLIGSNLNEMMTLLPLFYRGEVKSIADYRAAIEEFFPGQYEELIQVYPPENYRGRLTDGLRDILGDAYFHHAARENAAALAGSQEAPVYRYLYDFVSDHFVRQNFGAGHGLELSYLFGMPRGMSHLPAAMGGFTGKEKVFSRQLMSIWGQFMRNGELPSSQWTTYDPELDNFTRVGSTLRQDSKFREKECAYWLMHRNREINK